MIACINFYRSTNPHLTDFAHEIRIQQIRILAGSITSLVKLCSNKILQFLTGVLANKG